MTITVDTRPHPDGSLNTTPAIGFTRIVPSPPMLSLDDDTPLQCPLRQPGDDGACEACQ